MRAYLSRQDIKALNRLDKRRRMKYDGRHKERLDAEELGATREEVEGSQERYARQFSRPRHRHVADYR